MADFVVNIDIKYAKNMTDTLKDMVPASSQNIIDTVESIVQDEENDVQGDVHICEYDSNILQQKTFFEHHGTGDVISKERQKKVVWFVNYKECVHPDNCNWEWLLLYVPWQNEDIDLLQGQTSYAYS